jgi:methylmalonyl-CoA/ethylmalonyl-CoA epimerase
VSEPIVKAVEHVSIAVRDAREVQRTLAVLGFEPQWTEDLPGQGLRSHVLRAGEVVLELVEPDGQAVALSRFLDRRGEGLHHLCLRVDSVEDAIRAVEAAGMRLVSREPTTDEQGRRVFVHPDSAHGVLIGLVERHDRGGERHDRGGSAALPPPAPLAGPAGRRVVGASDPVFAGKTYVAAVAMPGTPMFVSGLTAADAAGQVQDNDVAGQARVIFSQLGRLLAEVGAGPASVVKTTDYILSREGYRAVADVRREFFGEHFPAATGIVVRELLGRGVLIEIDAVAML